MDTHSLATLLRVISTSQRLEIINYLLTQSEALPSSYIAAVLGMPDGQASFNLCKLAEVGVLIRTQSGRNRFYTPNRGMIKEMSEFFQKEIVR